MDEGKNHKKVQKYCAKLREGGLVSVYVSALCYPLRLGLGLITH